PSLPGMAAPPESALSLLECRVCFERFGPAGPRRPQNLPCGHVLCSGCLCGLRRPLCPFCRRPCGPPGAASECRPLLQLLELWGPAARPCPGVLAGPRQCLGGWGALRNPAGLAACAASARLAVVHDGHTRVALFGPGGRCLREFGPRGELRYPLGVAITPGGLVVVADGGDRALKAFDGEGRAAGAAREGLGLPWGLAVTAQGDLLVSDAEAGALFRVSSDLQQCRRVRARLSSPRAVAVCPRSGSVAVVEHLGGPARGSTRVRVFGADMRPLGQVDTFGLDVACQAPLYATAVAFDGEGRVLVTDVRGGAVVCLGRPEEFPTVTPLISQGLVYPIGLAYTADDSLVVLDSGDHSIKIYGPA
ncbi:NHLC1 ligase, partial [Xiphorhynchus elegans]|nr:NHLC1 ligase [Xiphorhynchus elegans]